MRETIKNRNARIAYYIFFLIMSGLKALGLSSNNKAFLVGFMLALVFLAIKIFYTDYKHDELLVIITLVLLSLIGFFRAKEQTYFLAAISIAGMKGINFRDLCKKTLWVHIVCSAIAVYGGMNGWLFNKTEIMNAVTGESINSYGYVDFNVLFSNMFIIAALYIYIRYEKLGVIDFVLTNVLMYWTYKTTHSRTGYLLFFAMWFLIILDKLVLKERLKKKLYHLYIYVPVLMVILSFVLPYLYGVFEKTKFMYWANRLLTGRLFIMNYYLELYPFTFFGNTYDFWVNNAGEILEIVDNLYCTIYLYSGVVLLIIYVAGVIALMCKLFKKRFDIELIMTTILCVYAFMEEFPLNPTVNPFAVLLAWVIFGGNIVRGDSDEESSDNNQHTVSVQS